MELPPETDSEWTNANPNPNPIPNPIPIPNPNPNPNLQVPPETLDGLDAHFEEMKRRLDAAKRHRWAQRSVHVRGAKGGWRRVRAAKGTYGGVAHS